jgi:hypothetical protein
VIPSRRVSSRDHVRDDARRRRRRRGCRAIVVVVARRRDSVATSARASPVSTSRGRGFESFEFP